MKIALIADVHANLDALSATIERARAAKVDRIVALGDLVGYHAMPRQCLDRIREEGIACVAGNHDWAAAGLLDTRGFGPAARRAIAWTREEITEEHRRYLASLPVTLALDEDLLLFHAALHPAPGVTLHLNREPRVRRSLEALAAHGARVGCFGHTHRAIVHYVDTSGRFHAVHGERVGLPRGARVLINPGSVGQPRDGDPRGSFAILDTREGEVRFTRVPFDHERVRRHSRSVGLLEPPGLPHKIPPITHWLRASVDLLSRRLR
jgi:hypothetical protein